MGCFAEISPIPDDPIFVLASDFLKDTSTIKVNLTIGAFRDEEGLPYLLPVIKEAERRLAQDPESNLEYLPIEGSKLFRVKAAEVMFGEECEALKKGLVATVQAVGGTGGLRLAFELLQRCCRIPYQLESGLVVYVPSPSWPNHVNIALESGVAPECLHRYRYYDEGEKEFNFKGMLEDLRAAPPGAVVLLHVCAHNPTGMDPTPSQWESIAEVVRKGALIPLFDNAYQGFATGKLEEDAYPVCLFERRGLQFLVVCSFSKSMGLYSTRTGALHAVCSSRREAEIVLGNLKSLARPMYSNPPAMGARAAAVVMSDKALKQQWKGELSFMAGRISRMRQLLVDNLKAVGAPGCWDHLVTQRGMFGYTGLTTVQVKRLREDHHVYMSSSGRISMAGVNKANVKYVAQCIKKVVTTGEKAE